MAWVETGWGENGACPQFPPVVAQVVLKAAKGREYLV